MAQPDPAPQRWPAMSGASAYQPKVISYDEFHALQRANGELLPLDACAGGVGATLDPLPNLGAAARADDGLREGDDGGAFGDNLFSPDSHDDSTPLANAQPFEYQPDMANGDSFDVAKTPNEGEPGTWYTNPGSGQMRMYGDNGKPVVDFDFDHDHGQGAPHAHNSDGTRGPRAPLFPIAVSVCAMNKYIDIRSISNFPSFHDAELYGIEHNPEAGLLELRFRRVGGELEVLKFSGVIAQRMIDFAGQNVASRLLISPRYAFTLAETRRWIQWINSRDDSKAALISEEEGQDYMRDFAAGRQVLFVLEPSCGAEMAVLCESVSLRQ